MTVVCFPSSLSEKAAIKRSRKIIKTESDQCVADLQSPKAEQRRQKSFRLARNLNMAKLLKHLAAPRGEGPAAQIMVVGLDMPVSRYWQGAGRVSILQERSALTAQKARPLFEESADRICQDLSSGLKGKDLTLTPVFYDIPAWGTSTVFPGQSSSRELGFGLAIAPAGQIEPYQALWINHFDSYHNSHSEQDKQAIIADARKYTIQDGRRFQLAPDLLTPVRRLLGSTPSAPAPGK